MSILTSLLSRVSKNTLHHSNHPSPCKKITIKLMRPMLYKKRSPNCTAFSLFYMFDLDRCGRCLQEEPPTEEEQDLVPWVFCLLCEQWFHCSCEQCDQHTEGRFECLRCRRLRARIIFLAEPWFFFCIIFIHVYMYLCNMYLFIYLSLIYIFLFIKKVQYQNVFIFNT